MQAGIATSAIIPVTVFHMRVSHTVRPWESVSGALNNIVTMYMLMSAAESVYNVWKTLEKRSVSSPYYPTPHASLVPVSNPLAQVPSI